MATVAIVRTIDDDSAMSVLLELGTTLNRGSDEVVLDLAAVRRLNASALRALEAFASKAEAESVKVVLRGVSVELYKVLTLVKLTARFSFVS